MRSCTVLFGDLRMFLAIIFGFRNEIYGFDSVIFGYVRLYTVGVGCERSYASIVASTLATIAWS